eukprot:CAMPEP_0119562044 /NCGR_PEP_ID=MMETSP1352-20130426/19348_1 /TAXON_ID=265584 /ORGANISM="Stauroneis constricta, Strain CCMP1120" /LENGTH=417 /DNA_ID=CAMNT_0007610383 /DNA_START=81 /DNA_END=1334 /DNA_ORIENTATION=+
MATTTATTPRGHSNSNDRAQHTIHAIISFLSCVFVVLALVIPTGEDYTVARAETKPQHLATVSGGGTKRGKPIGASFDSADLYRAYKEIEAEYHERAFLSGSNAAAASSSANQDSKQWKLLAERDGAQVSLMEHPSDPNCPYVRMTARIPASVEECWNFLKLDNWDVSMPKMDPFYEGVDIHGEFEHRKVHMLLAHKRTNRILAFGRRDFVFLSVSDNPLSDGTWVSGTVSVQTPVIPRKDGYTRAFQDSIAFYKPLNGNRETLLTIVCRIDLNDSTAGGSGGLIPMWLYVKTIGATGVRSVLNMRQALIDDAEERRRRKDEEEKANEKAKNGNSINDDSKRKRRNPFSWLGKNRCNKKNKQHTMPKVKGGAETDLTPRAETQSLQQEDENEGAMVDKPSRFVMRALQIVFGRSSQS